MKLKSQMRLYDFKYVISIKKVFEKYLNTCHGLVFILKYFFIKVFAVYLNTF